MTFILCIMAVILHSRCFQMDNCEPNLSFSKYIELDCYRWLYIWSYLWFSFQACSTQGVYSFTKRAAWGLAPIEDDTMTTTAPREQDWSCNEVIKTTGALWTDKYLQVVMTSQNVDLQELHILLNLDIASHLLHVVWICPVNGLVPIRQQAFNRTHDDKDKACHLVSSGHNNW